MPRSLERLQAEFSAALIEPASSRALSGALLGNEAGERLALYRGNIATACQHALALAYPVVRALVGVAFFAELAFDYARQHPSINGDLNRFGAELAAFVATSPHAQALPYLADIAALEWAVHLARRAADAQRLPGDRIAALRPEQLLAARFELHPSCSWRTSPYPIAGIWLAHQPRSDEPLPRSLVQAESALIARPRWQVQVLRASVAEVAALDALRGGNSMQAAIAAALQVDRDFDFAQAIVRWLDLAIFSAIAVD